jgi:hypothetical protein
VHHKRPRVPTQQYVGQIDYFGVYCPATGGVYLVPIADLPNKRQGALRVEPARNGQRRFVRQAEQYELASVIARRSAADRPIPLTFSTPLLEDLP